MIRLAIVGRSPFWPMIWNVYATPEDIAPAYRMGFHAARIFAQVGCSKSSMPMPARTAQVKNWMQDIFTPSTLVEK